MNRRSIWLWWEMRDPTERIFLRIIAAIAGFRLVWLALGYLPDRLAHWTQIGFAVLTVVVFALSDLWERKK